MVNVANRRNRKSIGQDPEQCGKVCTIRKVDLAVVAVDSNADPSLEEIMPTKIKEVLKEWVCTWMWKSLRLVGSDEWIKDAIEGWNLVAVTDGSYVKERYPHLFSAAFILKCSKRRGRVFVSFRIFHKVRTRIWEN